MRNAKSAIAGDIDLVDLWLSLVQRKWIFTGGFLIVLILGVVTAYIYPEHYAYSMVFQIGGTRGVDSSNTLHGAYQLVESPETLQAAIQNNYIPRILSEHSLAHPEWVRYTFDIEIPSKGDLVVISTKAPVTQDADVRNLMQLIGAAISNQENKTLKSYILLTNKLLLEEQSELQAQIDAAQKSRNQIAVHGNDASKAFTILMLDSQIAQEQAKLDAIQRELQVGLAVNIRFTDLTGEPTRSARPVGLSGALIVALSICLGFFVGGLAVAVSAFLQAGRARRGSFKAL